MSYFILATVFVYTGADNSERPAYETREPIVIQFFPIPDDTKAYQVQVRIQCENRTNANYDGVGAKATAEEARNCFKKFLEREGWITNSVGKDRLIILGDSGGNIVTSIDIVIKGLPANAIGVTVHPSPGRREGIGKFSR